MFIGLQGVSFLFRDSPGGYITYPVVEVITMKLGPVPVAFLVLVGLGAGGGIRAARHKARHSAARPGVEREFGAPHRVEHRPHLYRRLCPDLAACRLGAVMLMAQIGVGDPAQGANYTLASITAVVLGGTSLKGGRGTFIGTVLGALLLTEVLSMVTFLGLSQTYQYVFQGVLILAAALIYSAARGRAVD